MKFIDPHIHLFDLSLGQYQWLKAENSPFWPDKTIINHNFSEQDLHLTQNLELAGFVHIEAGFDNEAPWREIYWLESNCKGNFKTVASIDLTLAPETFDKQLQALLCYKSVVGLRHILDDSAFDILSHKNTFDNLKTLAHYQLSFDLQMPLADLKGVKTLSTILKKLPDLRVIVDHAGSPPYAYQDSPLSNNTIDSSAENSELSRWICGLKELSYFKQCAIKCSGWEMQDRSYKQARCEAIINHCISAFGVNRVMLGSNFPLCLFSKSYQDVWQYNTSLASMTQVQLEQLCLTNAKHWYKF